MRARFRFHGELEVFLGKGSGLELDYEFPAPGSLKDAIEAQGPPHPEVGSIRVNGLPARFEQLVRDGDTVDVYSCKPADDDMRNELPCMPPAQPRFVLDVHLGTLARYLRLLGCDTLYRNDFTDEELAAISSGQGRILLTRDIGLLKRGNVTYGHFMRAVRPHDQLQEVARRYRLQHWAAPFTRCIACNGALVPTTKQAIAADLPEHVIQYYEHFRQCTACRHIYWEGSHMTRMRAIVDSVLGQR